MSDWKNVQYKDGKMRTSEGGGGGGSSTFAGLDDVSFSDIQNGQVPKYNSDTGKWENANESGGGTVTDVEIDGVSVVNPQGVAEIETPDADGIVYDNRQSGLQAMDVQSAIDELAQGSGGGGVEDVKVNGTSVVNAQNVAEIKSYKEVTQAEYDTLPASKTSDGIAYFIKDGGTADGIKVFSLGDIYDTEEHEIGVWVDGKPLYQKTINLGTLTQDSNWHSIPHNISNIERVIEVVGWTSSYSNNSFSVAYNLNSYRPTSSYGIVLECNATNVNYLNNWVSGHTAYATIRYTKTTDVAGSGSLAQGGLPSHHYSTNERVVGTWIDGKPLYEKSIEVSGLVAGDNTIQHGISNFGKLISVTGYIALTDDSGYNPIPCISSASGWSARVRDFNSSTFIFEMGASIVAYYKKGTVILQYTKTTN